MSYKIVNKIDKKDSLPLEFESEKAAEIYFESNGMECMKEMLRFIF